MGHKSVFSISPIAAGVAAAVAAPATLAQDPLAEGARATIEEITVTARKRGAENIQDIPGSIQAIPEHMLNEMGVLSTEDYVRFMPSVTWRKESGGGDNQIIFRGINTGASDFIATASAAVYLDETSITMMGDQPDIRMMDVNRVEALAGPQGTLFGAAAQAGTLRIITNQPDASQFESSVDATWRAGPDSDPSYNLTGVLNIPLVEDVFAIRIAAQTAEDGGYIDNVLGHTPDAWFGYDSPGNGTYLGPMRAEWGTLDNAAVVEDNWNSVDHISYKIAARWDINENWAATVTYNYAENEANGGSDYNPFVGDLQTIAFAPNHRREEWDMWSLEIEADLGWAQFVSATSFFDRTYNFNQDATLYYKYWSVWACEDRGAGGYYGFDSDPGYAWYWLDTEVTGRAIYYPMYCPMGAARGSDPSQQADYIGTVEGPSWQDKFSQEIRLSHQGERFDWLAGLYYSESNDEWDAVWMKAISADYQDTTSLKFVEAKYGEKYPDAEYVFLSTDRTNWEQKAVFGEVTWHVTENWHATFGGRWFETTNEKLYLKYHAGHTGSDGYQVGGHIQPNYAPDTVGGKPVTGSISEFVPKISLAWQPSQDKMLYALYTEGHRTGGINRANAKADWTKTVFPQTFEPDKLASTEIGARTLWADGKVQFNVSYFNMQWEDFQIEIVDPSFGDCKVAITPCPAAETMPWLKVVGNVGDASSTGVEASLAWVPSERWTVYANAQWLEAEIDEDLVVDPGKKGPEYKVIVPKGTKLPNQGDFKASASVTYTWPVQFIPGGEMFLRGQYSYNAKSENLLIYKPLTSPDPSFTNNAYSLSDVRLGLRARDDQWQVDLFVNNITDERTDYYHGSGDHEWAFSHAGEYEHGQRVYTSRPREYGVRFTMRWGGD